MAPRPFALATAARWRSRQTPSGPSAYPARTNSGPLPISNCCPPVPANPGSPRGEIYKVDIRTGRQESWKNILPRDPAGIMVLVSFRVTPDGRSQAYTWHRALSNLYVADGLA
jgi:hypothetical protein